MRKWIAAIKWVHNVSEKLPRIIGKPQRQYSYEKECWQISLAYILHCDRLHAGIKSVGCMYIWSFAQKQTLAIHVVEMTRAPFLRCLLEGLSETEQVYRETSLCSNHCISVVTFKNYSTKNSAVGKCSQIRKMPGSRTCEKLAAYNKPWCSWMGRY